MPKIDLMGQKFTRLTVIKEAGRDKDKRVIWLCKCDCGNYHKALGKYLRNGNTTSCGCRRLEILKGQTEATTTHHMTNTRIYRIWNKMKHRCNNENDTDYKNYGGRGISVCEEWNDFMPFYEWAMSHGYSDELTIDRIDNNGNYEPSNCRWANHKTQGNNTRRNHYVTYKGETKSTMEWSEEIGINYRTLLQRLNGYHWPVEKAFETPVRKINRGGAYH